jgi:SulP family sulfate permease
LVHGLVGVPDGLANGLLAGLSPVSGLYGYLVGAVVGAVSTSSVLMTVQATGAMAVIVSDVPEVHHGQGQAGALTTLGILTGLVMLVLGLLHLGSLVRFIPNAVVTGFINAVAINIILGQLAGLTGYTSEAEGRLARAFATVVNVASFHWQTVLVGVITITLIVVLERTPLRSLGLVVAVVVGSLVAAIPQLGGVQVLRDISEVPATLPLPVLPSLAAVPALLIPALSLAFVGLVQGAAISQSVPNPNGEYPDVSGDFRGQGLANIASGILRGMPVGGSMSSTNLLVAGGAKSRLANLSAGAVMVVVILGFSELAGYIAMPALSGLLIVVGARMLRFDQVLVVWRTSPAQATIMVITFVLTLVIPLQYAVLVGIAIAVILFVTRLSNTLRVVRWVFEPGAPLPREEKPPGELAPHELVVLTIYGSLFFASAPQFTQQLPAVTERSRGSVVVLRLRGKDDLGSTIIQAITRYAAGLDDAGSHLLLAGIGKSLLAQLSATRALEAIGAEDVFTSTAVVGESLTASIARANELIERDQRSDGE